MLQRDVNNKFEISLENSEACFLGFDLATDIPNGQSFAYLLEGIQHCTPQMTSQLSRFIVISMKLFFFNARTMQKHIVIDHNNGLFYEQWKEVINNRVSGNKLSNASDK